MKIYKTNPLNNSITKYINPQKNITKTNFYSNIKKYMNNSINKNEYLDKFLKNVDKIHKKNLSDKFDPSEKKYINNMLMTIDLAEKIDKISDKYLKDTIKELLKNKNLLNKK